MAKKPIIGITQGDSNGVGYEIIIKSVSDPRILEMFTPVVYGSSRLFGYYRKGIAGLEPFNVHTVTSVTEANPKLVNILQCVPDNLSVDPGTVTADGAQAALLALEAAVKDLKAGAIQAIVTAPFNKHSVNEKGFSFPGHTEYLTHAFGAGDSLMFLCSDRLKIGVVTGHLPLSQVAGKLSVDLIYAKICLMAASLREDFGIRQPKIAVLGLNPHAGESGLLGHEEQQIIAPAVEKAAAEGVLAFGPFSPDSFFARPDLCRFDGVLAMYHDQGLIPFKTLSFDQGVNFTAGLPVVRTSPDHGTAYDIVNKDMADPGSFLSALYMACDILRNRRLRAELTLDPLMPYKQEGARID